MDITQVIPLIRKYDRLMELDLLITIQFLYIKIPSIAGNKGKMRVNELNHKRTYLVTLLTSWSKKSRILSARRILFILMLQFIVSAHYFTSLRLSMNKERYIYNANQLRFFDL